MTENDDIIQAVLPQYYAGTDSGGRTMLVVQQVRGKVEIFLDKEGNVELVSDIVPCPLLERITAEYSALEEPDQILPRLINLTDELSVILSRINEKSKEEVLDGKQSKANKQVEELPEVTDMGFDKSSILCTESMEIYKSKFYCSITNVTTLEEVEEFLEYIHTDSRTSDATHSIAAWVLSDGEDGFDEDGEKGAGKELLFLLEKMKIRNYCVAVHRWFGGVLLGPKRFQIINNNAREAVELLCRVRRGEK